MSEPKYDQKMYLALEARAIYDNQWILGVQKNQPVVELEAAEDFTEKFGQRFREYYESNIETILDMCDRHCNKSCKGVGRCDIDPDTLHSTVRLI